MGPMRQIWWPGLLATLLTAGAPAMVGATGTPTVRQLRTQRVGDAAYFHVRFDAPADMRVPRIEQWKGSDLQRRMLARLPQLVPQDGNASAVYPRVQIPDFYPAVGFSAAPVREPVPVQGLEFVGKIHRPEWTRFLLLYCRDPNPPAPPLLDERDATGKGSPPTRWAQVPVELDLSAAVHLDPPDFGSKRRQPGQPPAADDLQGLWASAQADRFAVLEALAPDFGFYGFAAEATARKYGVRAPMLERGPVANAERVHRQLYETTTGSAAITQSLQLHRMIGGEPDRGRRTVDVTRIRGIDIADHPWLRMMGSQHPDPEPLARLVPHDNFYVHFKSVRKFIEFGEVLDQWGTNLVQAYEVNSRDYQIRQRYEKQLCLRSTWAGKALGEALVRGLALTGSDGYLREGSDVAVIFHVNDVAVFLKAVDPFLQDARKEYGGRLKESKADYHGVTAESFVTPLREVSLHRAAFGDFVVYANSPVGLRRVLDAHQGRLKALADSLDFQYMRTVFRQGDEREDGFAFLSDAFIRQLVGPASKIKEKRRLEALTSLGMVTHAAMFHAWETGRLPAGHGELLAGAALKPQEIYTPEGKGVTWDADRNVAVSDVYNTLHFPTPLVELPIDKVTAAEEQEYDRFRREYLQLWRQFFDPVGMRFSMDDRLVRVETYILPLIQLQEYNFLRQLAADGTAALDTARFSPLTLVQGTFHLSDQARKLAEAVFQFEAGVGDWALIRVDDTSALARLAEWWVRQEFSGVRPANPEWDALRQLQHFPVTLGIQVKDPKKFDDALKRLQDQNFFLNFTRKALAPYKGVTFTRLEAKEAPVLYHARIDDAWYLSTSEASLRDLVDRSAEHGEGGRLKAAAKEKPVLMNGSVYLAPAAANQGRQALQYYLGWQSHRRALVNGPMLYSLFRSGLIREDDSAEAKRAVALRYLGFVPVSPDGASFAYEAKTDEVVNRRHGSLRQPIWHRDMDAGSPLARLLDQFQTLRADLRFKEDGVQTTVTIERKTGTP